MSVDAKRASSKRGHGEGAIYEQGGRWRAVVDLGWDNGKRKRKYLSGKTKREVLQKLALVQQARAQGLTLPPERQTVGPYLERWLTDVAQPSVRASTFVRYRELLTIHAIPTLGKRPLAKLAPQDLQALYGQKLKEGLSAQTVVHLHRVLHRALVQAVRWNLVPRNVCDLVDPPRVTRKEVRPLDADQARTLLAAAQGDPFEALYILALTTGMRQGELFALRWDDVDLDAGTLQVRRSVRRIKGQGFVDGEPKSDRGRRNVALAAIAVAALRRHRARQLEDRLRAGALWEDCHLVFPNSIGRTLEPSTVLQRYRALLKRAELPRVRFHDLRHSVASLLLRLHEHPKVVQELLGHSAIGLTLDTYSHLMPNLKREAVDRLGKLLEANS